MINFIALVEISQLNNDISDDVFQKNQTNSEQG